MYGISLFDLSWLVVSMLAAGALTGLLAGVFGVGGGAVAVPILYELFRLVGVPEEVRMPLCVGTSLAIIIPTSIRSFMAHRAKGAVDMSILRVWAVPVVVGVIMGSFDRPLCAGGSLQDGVRAASRGSRPSASCSARIPGGSASTCRPSPS